MKIFAERLVAARTKQKLERKDVALAMNVTLPTVTRWENGDREPNLDTIHKLAAALNTTVAYLMGEIDTVSTQPDPNARFGSFVEIPLLDINTVASCNAGNSLYGVIHESHETIFASCNLFTHCDDIRRPFGIRIDGDSMSGAGLEPGSVAIVNPADDVNSGDMALVLWNGNWIIKWVLYIPDGSLELRSANPAYGPITVDKELAHKPEWFHIVGRVVEVAIRREPRRAF